MLLAGIPARVQGAAVFGYGFCLSHVPGLGRGEAGFIRFGGRGAAFGGAKDSGPRRRGPLGRRHAACSAPPDYGATPVPTQKSAFRMRRFFDEASISTFLFCAALCCGFCRRAMSVSLRSCSCPRGTQRRCGLPPASCSARRSTRCPSCFPERQLRRLPGTAHRCGPRLPRRLPA